MKPSALISVPVSPGELLDKIAILSIKREHMNDATKVENVTHELTLLSQVRDEAVVSSPDLTVLYDDLQKVNQQLWDIEDKIRLCERDRNFGPTFVELARNVYRTNDQRAALKRQINHLLGAEIIEEKQYADY